MCRLFCGHGNNPKKIILLLNVIVSLSSAHFPISAVVFEKLASKTAKNKALLRQLLPMLQEPNQGSADVPTASAMMYSREVKAISSVYSLTSRSLSPKYSLLSSFLSSWYPGILVLVCVGVGVWVVGWVSVSVSECTRYASR